MIKKIIIGQLSFFSAIPVKSNYSIDEIAKYSFLAPIIVGVLLGIIEFLSYSILYIFFANLASILLLGIIELLRGFNHLDGLLDLGDALMVKGDRERKIRALKDTQVGSGGIGLLIIYLSIQIVALIKLNGISILSLLSIVSADVLSRSLSLSALGTIKPMPESFLGKIFHEGKSRSAASKTSRAGTLFCRARRLTSSHSGWARRRFSCGQSAILQETSPNGVATT